MRFISLSLIGAITTAVLSGCDINPTDNAREYIVKQSGKALTESAATNAAIHLLTEQRLTGLTLQTDSRAEGSDRYLCRNAADKNRGSIRFTDPAGAHVFVGLELDTNSGDLKAWIKESK